MIIKAINNRLQGSVDIEGIVGDKIYPLFIKQKDPAPAIAFNSSTIPERSKSTVTIDSNSSEIICISKSYKEAAELAQIVRDLFENWAETIDGIRIMSSKVVSIDRSYDVVYGEYTIAIGLTIISKTI